MRRLALLFLLAGCGGGSTEPTIPPGTQIVPFYDVGGLFGMDRIVNQWTGAAERRVIHNQTEWGQLYLQVTGTAPAPGVDFSDRHMFFATTGRKISTGHDILVEEVRKDDAGKLYVIVRSVTPGTGCNIAQTPTSPVTAIVTISVYTAVVWVERDSVDKCTSS